MHYLSYIGQNMDNLITLSLKCPHCGKSLMDDDQLVDGAPSIRLIYQIGKLRDVIRFSSFYGSYNYSSVSPVPDGEIASFFCPNCKTEIKSDHSCETCKTPMVTLILDSGGKVSFCPKSGCKDHKVEFDDPNLALMLFYRKFGFRGRDYPKDLDLRTEIVETHDEEDSKKEIIKTGAFLQTYCPHCRKSLIENNMLKIKIKGKVHGELLLSPYLNVYTLDSSISLTENESVGDMVCPHCEVSIIDSHRTCKLCDSTVARFSVSARTKLIDFFVCSKKGCKWHGLSDEDVENIRLEDSSEW